MDRVADGRGTFLFERPTHSKVCGGGNRFGNCFFWKSVHHHFKDCYRVLKGPGVVQGEAVFLSNPKDSVWVHRREYWGNPSPLEPPGTLNNPIRLCPGRIELLNAYENLH